MDPLILILGVTIVVIIFIIFVLTVVMAALRPSASSFLIRRFTSKNAESDEENQGQTSINWQKGGLRLTIVLSILLGSIAGIINVEFYDSSDAFLVGFLVSFAMTWLIYFATSFVIRGFRSKK